MKCREFRDIAQVMAAQTDLVEVLGRFESAPGEDVPGAANARRINHQ